MKIFWNATSDFRRNFEVALRIFFIFLAYLHFQLYLCRIKTPIVYA